MPVQKILLYPHQILKKPCRQVTAIDGEIGTLVADLIDTMRAGPGSVGVAAPQIGVTLRVCVVDVSDSRMGKENNHGLLVMVNPEVVATLGRVALTYFLPRAKITLLRGRTQSIERNGRTLPLLPLLHPAAVLRRRTEMLPGMREDFSRLPGLLAGG